jgi:hypothetical protein
LKFGQEKASGIAGGFHLRTMSKSRRGNCSPGVCACNAKNFVRRASIAKCGEATAFSIQLFTETEMLSGFFLKKKPPCTISKRQHVNRKCSKQLHP